MPHQASTSYVEDYLGALGELQSELVFAIFMPARNNFATGLVSLASSDKLERLGGLYQDAARRTAEELLATGRDVLGAEGVALGSHFLDRGLGGVLKGVDYLCTVYAEDHVRRPEKGLRSRSSLILFPAIDRVVLEYITRSVRNVDEFSTPRNISGVKREVH